jgi:hypothetical protein
MVQALCECIGVVGLGVVLEADWTLVVADHLAGLSGSWSAMCSLEASVANGFAPRAGSVDGFCSYAVCG